jgi:hypothetical protein
MICGIIILTTTHTVGTMNIIEMEKSNNLLQGLCLEKNRIKIKHRSITRIPPRD